jgi:transcriptional regulator GlxA family with amidase domain
MRVIGVLLLDGTRLFDFAVVGEVWQIDRSRVGLPSFEVRLCAPTPDPVDLHPSGSATPTHDLAGLAGCDLVIALGRVDPMAHVPDEVVAALRAAHRGGAVVAGLCSGAFTLAAAGLLDGRPATTHWALLEDLARVAPAADITHDVLFTDDGDVCTSAGVVGGLDLCLHLVRRDHGADTAGTLARRMVMPPVRGGGQRQYVTAPVPVRPDRSDIASTVDWAVTALGEPIGVPDLARRAGMSERTFHREFMAATGATPGRWLLSQRVQHAQRLLETTDLPVGRIAERAGLGSAANLRRRLRAELGVGPDAYRRNFRI